MQGLLAELALLRYLNDFSSCNISSLAAKETA